MRRKHFLWLLVILLPPLVLGGCKKDDDSTELNDNCYVKTFALGSVKRYIHTKSSTGADSVYTVTYSGSLFPMTIDPKTLTIENKDSLPYNSDVHAVLATITGEGTVSWRKKVDTNQESISWTVFSSTDSIDFTSPIQLRVTASSARTSRIYSLKVNVHQVNGEEMVWKNHGQIDPLADIADIRLFCLKGQLLTMGLNASGQVVCHQRLNDTWLSVATGIKGGDVSGIQLMADKLYMTDDAGRLYVSANGTSWAECGEAPVGIHLCAASSSRLYGIHDGVIRSTSDFKEWTASDALDAPASNLPIDNINGLFFTTEDSIRHIMLLGNTNGQTSIWSKVWRSAAPQDEAGVTWCYYTPNAADAYHLPLLAHLNVLVYDEGLIAFGGTGDQAMKYIYYSPDNGIAWKGHDNMGIDSLLQQQAQTCNHIASVIDDDHNIWILIDNNLWCGRLNRTDFDREDLY